MMSRRQLAASFPCLIPRRIAAQPPPANDDFLDRLLDFHRAWDSFIRTYLGCAPDAITSDDCKAHLGKLDRSQYTSLRKKASSLFELHDKQQ